MSFVTRNNLSKVTDLNALQCFVMPKFYLGYSAHTGWQKISITTLCDTGAVVSSTINYYVVPHVD